MSNDVLVITEGSKTYRIRLGDVLFIQADSNYISIYLTRLEKYSTIRYGLEKAWNSIVKLNATHSLAKIGRSHILNLKYIEFVNIRKGLVTMRCESGAVHLKLAKAACKPLSGLITRIYKPSAIENVGVATPSRDIISIDNNQMKKYLDHYYVDLQLPSGNLWAVFDIDTSNEFGFYDSLFDSPYIAINNYYPKDQFEHYLDAEDDAARIAWGGFWRLPTQEEWQELINNSKLKWGITDDNERVCEVTGKNGNKIILSSIIQSRGLCTYWAPLTRKDDIYEILPHNFSVEFHEPYANEPGYCFSSNFDGVKRKIHAVVSPEDILKEWHGVPMIKAISEKNRRELEEFADF